MYRFGRICTRTAPCSEKVANNRTMFRTTCIRTETGSENFLQEHHYVQKGLLRMKPCSEKRGMNSRKIRV